MGLAEIIPDFTSDKELAFRLGWSVRRVRTVAKNAGACYLFGRNMLFRDGDVAVMEGIASGELKKPEDFRHGPPAQSCHVYIIRQGEYVKIGWSAKWRSRVSIIQTANPLPIEVLAVYRGSVKYERALHDKFAAHRTRAEWFRYCDEISVYIEENKRKCVKDAKVLK